jgi:hypothetical protein
MSKTLACLTVLAVADAPHEGPYDGMLTTGCRYGRSGSSADHAQGAAAAALPAPAMAAAVL